MARAIEIAMNTKTKKPKFSKIQRMSAALSGYFFPSG
jgi:hypothetical protein